MSGRNRLRVLVVEDDLTSATLIRKVLESRGHEAQVCETAEAGLEAHERTPFPLMVVDWLLPGMSGVDFCKRIRNHQANDDVVILMVTGRDSAEDLATVLSAGASDFLAKPVPPSHLATRIAVAERAVRERARRRQAETALAVAKAEFETIYRSIPDAVLFTDRSQRILRVNPAFSELFGFDAGEVVGKEVNELLAERASLPTARFGSEDRGTSLVIARKQGGEFVADVKTADVRDADGRVTGSLTIFRDITERTRLEARLQVADRMASMGTLAAGVAHEINNPLTFIMGNLNYLGAELRSMNERGSPEDLAELEQTVSEALEGSERVRRIVRELKTFARGDEDEVGPVDIHDVLEKTLSLAKNNIRHKAQLVRDYGEVPAVHGNPSKLGQVFLNLLVNAAEALPSGRAPEHEIRVKTALASDGRVQVSVSDSGPGVPPEVRAEIFNPFYTTKPVGQGTGLGLAICHGIVTSLGGEITLDSPGGRGATFSVWLPVEAA